MTLRLALLLASLFILGLIGLICHFKYRQLHPNKRIKASASISDSEGMHEESVDAPFINENIISDIPNSSESLLEPAQSDPQLDTGANAPELKTSLKELIDKKQISQSIAAQLLPVYNTDDFIFEHVAVLPNVKTTAKTIQTIFEMQPARLKNNVVLTAIKNKDKDFVPVDSIKAKQKITHLKAEFKIKQKTGMADDAVINEFEALIHEIAEQSGSEYHFALTIDEVITARETVKTFIKDNDLIILLYILAKPESSFEGLNLQKAVTAAGLEYGEFKFFQFQPESGANQNQKLFSLANMYKPGSFDLDSMDKFSTMGLCAFMVPALVNDPISGFSEMCTRCNQITDELSGVLTTNKRELLNEENYKHICNRISEHTEKLAEKGIKNGSEISNRLFA